MKTVKIVDYYGKTHIVPVEDSVYEEMMHSDVIEKRQNTVEERHRAKDANGENKDPDDCAVADDLVDLADIVIARGEKQALYDAITRLTPIQRRRVYMYMMDMSYVDIARAEHRDTSVIRRSMLKSFKNLRRILTEAH